jgi:hypothetical protein
MTIESPISPPSGPITNRTGTFTSGLPERVVTRTTGASRALPPGRPHVRSGLNAARTGVESVGGIAAGACGSRGGAVESGLQANAIIAQTDMDSMLVAMRLMTFAS